MRGKFPTFGLALFLLFTPFARAQDLTLDWAGCVDSTLENNHQLKAKMYDMKQSEYSYLASLNSYLPKISLSHSFSRSGSETSPPSNRFSLSASVDQSIFNLKTLSSIKVSRISYETARLNYEIFLSELRKSLYTAYLNLFFAQETLEANKKILQIREENAKLIKLKYESGMESKGNMLYAKAQYEMAKLSLTKSERSLASYRNELAKTMGVTPAGSLTIKDDLKVPVSDFDPARIKEYMNYYPDIKVYSKNLETARERLLSAKYDAYPNLNFGASVGYSGVTEFPQNRSWSMSLGMSLPLFSGGITYYSRNKASLDNSLKSTEETLKNALPALENDLKNFYQDFLNAVDTINTYKILLEANEERYKEGQIQYMSGTLSFINLENLEQNLVDSRLNYLDYVKTANLKKVALERLLGVKLEREE